MKHPDLVKRSSFKTSTLISNVASVEANRRYVETDMNRCFLLADLENPELDTLEHKRAREINAQLGPKASPDPSADIVFDLHNTTANSGFLLLMAPGVMQQNIRTPRSITNRLNCSCQDDFSHLVAAHLMKHDPEVRVCQWSDKPDWALCPSVGRSGMTVEVGPIPHSTAEAEWFQITKKHVLRALDFIETHNAGLASRPSDGKRGRGEVEKEITVFQLVGHVDYPRDDDGELLGLIHPTRQGADFKPIKEGDAAFLMHDGSVQNFEVAQCGALALEEASKGNLYSFFVNEAAYYEKKMAFMVAKKVQRKIFVPDWLADLV